MTTLLWRAPAPAAALLLLSLAAPPALAATVEGEFAVRGIGAQPCGALAAALDGQESAAVTASLSAWVSGWLSHANRVSEGGFDLMPLADHATLARILGEVCRQNPDSLVETVLFSVTASLESAESSAPSETVTVTADDRSLALRAAVLRRAQARLAELGLLEAAMADGSYGPATRTALAAFQEQRSIEPTGLPDDVTLYLLFQPE